MEKLRGGDMVAKKKKYLDHILWCGTHVPKKKKKKKKKSKAISSQFFVSEQILDGPILCVRIVDSIRKLRLWPSSSPA